MISKKITLTLTIAALTFCSFAAEPAKNWIRNGSFEKTPAANGQVDNWSVPKTMKIVPGGKDGKQYLEGKGITSTWGLGLQAGKTYKLSFWVKKGGKWLGVTIYGVDSKKKQVKAKDLQVYYKTPVKDWTLQEMTFTLPADFKHGRVIFSTHGGVISLDGVSIVEVQAETPAANNKETNK